MAIRVDAASDVTMDHRLSKNGKRIAPIRMAACHPTVKHYAKGWCRSCWQSEGPRTKAKATCHPTRSEHKIGSGICASCATLARISANPPAKCHPERPEVVIGKGLCNACTILLRKFGRTLKYEEHRCEICTRPLKNGKAGMRSGVTDHCHGCGATRGVLCQGCNIAIGLVGEDTSILRRAAEYLVRHKIACG
jgi:hypothetical protein